MNAIQVLHERLKSTGTVLILSGVNTHVRRFLQQTHIDQEIGEERIVDHIDRALDIAKRIVNRT
jgi:anti-anti-sigma regulatory factor